MVTPNSRRGKRPSQPLRLESPDLGHELPCERNGIGHEELRVEREDRFTP